MLGITKHFLFPFWVSERVHCSYQFIHSFILKLFLIFILCTKSPITKFYDAKDRANVDSAQESALCVAGHHRHNYGGMYHLFCLCKKLLKIIFWHIVFDVCSDSLAITHYKNDCFNLNTNVSWCYSVYNNSRYPSIPFENLQCCLHKENRNTQLFTFVCSVVVKPNMKQWF